MSKVPRVRLRPGKAEKLRQQRHPWLFSGAFAPDAIAEAGDTVAITDEHGNLIAYGHWDPDHPIRARVFAWQNTALQPNQTFWHQKWEKALHLRQSLALHTNSYRLLNSEGDHSPGIIVDIYADVAVLQLRTPGARRLQPTLVRFLEKHLSLSAIYLRSEKIEDSAWVFGTPKPYVFLTEYGLQFKVYIETGQKTGFFLDQRENRYLLQRYAQGHSVANFFAYTGGFTVHAAAAGAARLLSVEIMEEPAALIAENLAHNNLSHVPHTLWVEDAFLALDRLLPGEWEIIILDPPAFTHSQEALPQALRGYRHINRQALRLLPPGGLLFTFSCSGHVTPHLFRDVLFQAAMEAGRPIQILHFLHAPPDHPIDFFHPQGEYLKGFVLRVE